MDSEYFENTMWINKIWCNYCAYRNTLNYTGVPIDIYCHASYEEQKKYDQDEIEIGTIYCNWCLPGDINIGYLDNNRINCKIDSCNNDATCGDKNMFFFIVRMQNSLEKKYLIIYLIVLLGIVLIEHDKH